MALFKPVSKFHRVTDITVQDLESLGIKAVALDADNTLSEHHSQIPLEGVQDWIKYVKDSGISVMMVSNAKAQRVMPFAAKLGLEYVCLALKPLPFGFLRAAKQNKIPTGQMAVIGDQLFTDMMGANLCGAKGLLVEPIKIEDGFTFKVRRKLEEKLLRKYGRDI